MSLSLNYFVSCLKKSDVLRSLSKKSSAGILVAQGSALAAAVVALFVL